VLSSVTDSTLTSGSGSVRSLKVKFSELAGKFHEGGPSLSMGTLEHGRRCQPCPKQVRGGRCPKGSGCKKCHDPGHEAGEVRSGGGAARQREARRQGRAAREMEAADVCSLKTLDSYD